MASRTKQPRAGSGEDGQVPPGWKPASPREEIDPFLIDPKGGRTVTGSLIITAEDREGQRLVAKTLPIVVGGEHYGFHAQRKVQNVKVPRRSTVARIVWQDDKESPCQRASPQFTGYLKGWAGNARAGTPHR